MNGNKKRVPGWTYGHSEVLQQDFAFRKSGNGLELYTEDKTHYNWHEISVISKHKDGLPLQVHLIKKAFMGEIIL
jgi:hypothetical protein